MEIYRYEKTGIQLIDGEALCTRKQIIELYEVPAMTLSDNIKKLKEDGLIESTVIRNKNTGRDLQVFSLDEVISIGLRLRSKKAIDFQRWARKIIKYQMTKLKTDNKILNVENGRLWNWLDQKDLYS